MRGREGRGKREGAPPTRGLCTALPSCGQAGMLHAPGVGVGPKAANRMCRFGTDGNLRCARACHGGAVPPCEGASRPDPESTTAGNDKSTRVTPAGGRGGALRPRRQGTVLARCGAALLSEGKTAGRAGRPQASAGGACCMHAGYSQVGRSRRGADRLPLGRIAVTPA